MIKTLLLFVLISVFFASQSAFAQLTFGEPVQQKSIEVKISEEGKVHVVHEIRNARQVRTLEPIPGTLLNLKVVDKDGNEVQHGIFNGDKMLVTIFPSEKNVFVEYDLKDVLKLKEDLWAWDFLYHESTTFDLPNDTILVFANKIPIKIDDNKIRCHGCQMLLEFSLNQPTIIKNTEWKKEKFNIVILTSAEIKSFNFSQPTKSISFEITESDKYITLVIPLKLLWNPYEVYVGDEKILRHEFAKNETHAWLNVKPQSVGTVTVIGTSVIPEFPLFTPLVIGMIIIIGLQIKNGSSLR